MILHPPPGAPILVSAAAASVLALHIGGGMVGILSGAAALGFRKGSRPHAMAGNVFFVSMMIMSAIGAVVSPFLPQRANVVPGLFTFYLVVTGWLTIRRGQDRPGVLDIGALLFALGAAAIGLTFGLQAANSPTGLLDGDAPPTYFVFASFAALAAAADVSVIVRRGVSGPQRLARHLWRMCLALLIAVISLFLGQPKVFPPSLRGSPVLFLPVIAVLGLMIFWLIRVLLIRRFVPGRGRTVVGRPDPLPT
jgi:hypothetical protein